MAEGEAPRPGVEEEEEEEEAQVPTAAILQQASARSIDLSNLRLGRCIGKGAFSTVYRGHYFGDPVAVKRLRLSAEDGKYLMNELSLLLELENDHLIKYYGGAVSEDQHILVVTELFSCTLGDLISRRQLPMPWLLRCRLARDALRGIVALHEEDMMHRDIKSDNILVDDTWRAAVADYGFARKTDRSQVMTLLGTEEYMAPEVIWAEQYAEKADVFSFGLVLCELITRRRVSEGFLRREPKDKFELKLDEFREACPEDVPDALVRLVEECVAADPDDRLESGEALDWLEAIVEDLEAEEDEAEGQVAATAAVPVPSRALLLPKVAPGTGAEGAAAAAQAALPAVLEALAELEAAKSPEPAERLAGAATGGGGGDDDE